MFYSVYAKIQINFLQNLEYRIRIEIGFESFRFEFRDSRVQDLELHVTLFDNEWVNNELRH